MNEVGTQEIARVGTRRRFPDRCTPAMLLLTGLFALVACGTSKPPVVDFSVAPEDYRSEDYRSVYWRWTRHEKVTANLESALEVWATYKSRDYREAFVAHYAEAYSLGDAAREQLRQGQHEAADSDYEFIVTAQSANYKWNDLEKKNSPWRVTLVDGAGREISPEEIRIEKLPDMFEREFYPVKTPFSKTYLARFLRSAGKDEGFAGERSGRIALRFAGPLGHAELVWSAR
jgi:hypothetical protein